MDIKVDNEDTIVILLAFRLPTYENLVISLSVGRNALFLKRLSLVSALGSFALKHLRVLMLHRL